MNPSHLVLSRDDHARLRTLLRSRGHESRLEIEPTVALATLLDTARVTDDETILADHVGLDDEVLLVSPANPRDTFRLIVVPPAEADVDRDRISVALPISRAVLGRRRGETVTWLAPVGVREMRIETLRKAAPVADG